jgi:hypothetical protein
VCFSLVTFFLHKQKKVTCWRQPRHVGKTHGSSTTTIANNHVHANAKNTITIIFITEGERFFAPSINTEAQFHSAAKLVGGNDAR